MGKIILNLCCGHDRTGTNFLDLNPKFKRVIKQDLNKNPILPYKGKKFDEVIFSRSIEYMISPQKILEEIYRVLKNKGILKIETFNCQSKRFFFRPLKDRYSPRGWTEKRLSMYDIHTLSNRLKIAKFKISEVNYKQLVFPFNDFFEIVAIK